jgi:hypothetical protein
MKMMLTIKDNKAAFFMELLKNFPYVKTEPLTKEKHLLINEIKEAVDELKLVRSGKKKARNAEDFLNEL